MTHNAEVFLDRWQRWDEQPREESGAIAVTDLMIELGEELGIGHIQVRRRLAASRRNGLSYRDAYNVLMEGTP